jgi:hypothetical protein
MGGGGGGGGYSPSPKDITQQVLAAQNKKAAAAFETELADHFATLLAEYNNRDHSLIAQRREDLTDVLATELEGVFDQYFGGSVAKRTYVDGLSDVDCLLILNDSDLEGHSPEEALENIASTLQSAAPEDVEVTYGEMAVTAAYSDGMEIQLLPAIKDADGVFRIPDPKTDKWAQIDPKAFQEALTRRNQECGGKLVPVIKLAKAINGNLPDDQQLSGYHIESLAIAAFRNYSGTKSPTTMLPYFIEQARTLVLSPIRDSTGQSVHVDEYLGPANSAARQSASHILGGIARRMRNATAAGSIGQWDALFDDAD